MARPASPVKPNKKAEAVNLGYSLRVGIALRRPLRRTPGTPTHERLAPESGALTGKEVGAGSDPAPKESCAVGFGRVRDRPSPTLSVRLSAQVGDSPDVSTKKAVTTPP